MWEDHLYLLYPYEALIVTIVFHLIFTYFIGLSILKSRNVAQS